jgi:hypothetical protein
MSDTDDWQSHALTTRHMHNRNQSSKSKSKSNKPFDVHKTFSIYSVKCPAWQKVEGVQPDQTASLELYRLTANGEGVLGELTLPGALRASVVLAASRKTLMRCVREMEKRGDDEEEEDGLGDGKDDDDDDDDDEEDGQDRFSTFEKNSFRNPKFWMQWSGTPETSAKSKALSARDESSDGTVTDTGLGYVVFSNNECRKFKGTLNCSALKWKDVAISGWKEVGRGERDVEVNWAKR